MKIQQIFEETEIQKTVEKWVLKWCLLYDAGYSQFDTNDEVTIDAAGKVTFSPKVKNVEFCIDQGEAHDISTCPFDYLKAVEGMDSVSFTSFNLGGKDLPNVKLLSLHSLSISDLKGVNHLDKVTTIELTDVEFNGVLGLLKFPNLKNLRLRRPSHATISDEMYDALVTVKNNLPDKDVLACQTELIDHDLEKYATL